MHLNDNWFQIRCTYVMIAFIPGLFLGSKNVLDSVHLCSYNCTKNGRSKDKRSHFSSDNFTFIAPMRYPEW